MTTPEAALAAALVKSDLMRRYMDYAHDAHPLIGRETVEEIAANWAPLVLAALPGWTLVPKADAPDGCVFPSCAATWRHWHGGFPGGYNNPADPDGPPIPFEGDDPNPSAVRDYNGAALAESPK